MKKKKLRKTHPRLLETIRLLEKGKARIWKRLASDLKRPRRIWRRVNLERINKYTKEGDVVVVPGKVLGIGFLDHKIKIWAFSFSEAALRKLKEAKAEILDIKKLMKENPRGSGVKLIG